MNARRLAVLGVPVLLVAAVAVAVLMGAGPSAGPDGSVSETATPVDTQTGEAPTVEGTTSPDGGTVTGDGAAGTATATPAATSTAAPPFAFTVDNIEECGTTCRDVTSTLTNQQGDAARNVTVTTRIYAGNGTDGDVVWEGSERVGRLGAGESYTATRRVELSYGEAYTVQREGWVTVETTVRTADRTVTFSDRRQVA